MKTSLEWLSEYLPGPLKAEQAADALTNGGLPVELIEPHGNDMVIDVEVTSNRGDCLSHIGVARELAALLNRKLAPLPPFAAPPLPSAGQPATSVQIEALDLCPHYTARVIRNVKIGPSPAWMVRRLESAGVRSINNIVDVTNYVMLEMGQPLHAFDMDHLRDGRIVVRRATPGEKIVSIDGHERALSTDMLVIADAQRPVAVAGVMGGLESEVSSSTVNVLLESARFDPLSIRKTSRALAMKSESSYRFERRIDPTLPERASQRATQLILQVAGGEVIGPLVAGGASGYEPRVLSLRLNRLQSVLGLDIPAEKVLDALSRLQLAPVRQGDAIQVSVPSWRLDISIEADLVEEVARVVGYNSIPVRQEISIKLAPPDRELRTIDLIADILTGAGYFEAIGVSFVSDALRQDFVSPEAASLLRADEMVRKDNAHLRPSLLPGLLEAVRRNETVGTPSARLFEIGSTFWLGADGKVDERRRLALAGSAELREVRGALEVLLSRLNADRPLVIIPDSRPGFASGACGRIEWGGRSIGYLGRADRVVAGKLSLRELPCIAELELPELLENAQHVPQLHALPRYPAVRRDLSLVLAENTRFEQIERTIRALNLPSLEDLEYVTTYRGKPLEQGTKSVTVTLVFRSPTTTLTSDAVEQSVQQAIQAAKTELNAALRA